MFVQIERHMRLTGTHSTSQYSSATTEFQNTNYGNQVTTPHTALHEYTIMCAAAATVSSSISLSIWYVIVDSKPIMSFEEFRMD